MRFCFISTSRGSPFMTELLSALCEAATAAGHSAELAFDAFPPDRDECTFVVIPHEFDAWGTTWPSAWQRERTIALCTENAGTPWFEATYEIVPQFALAVAINRASAAELQRRGIRCEHLQLGYTSRWDNWRGDEGVERKLDALYLGAADPRRDPLLASIGKELWAWNCQFLIPPLEPRTRARPDFLMGSTKYDRLRSARILLNLHRTTSTALEWMRFLEAISNGCVVVSEPCRDSDPLIADEHYISVDAAAMGSEVDRLLQAPDRLAAIRRRSYDFVRSELPMASTTVSRLSELALELPRRPQAPDSGARARPMSSATGAPAPTIATASAEEGFSLHREISSPATIVVDLATDDLRSRARSATRHFRKAARLKTIQRTSTFARDDPSVSVLCVAAPEGGGRLIEALESVAASQFASIELLVSAQPQHDHRLSDFLHGHDELPASLVRQLPRDGMGASLNRLIERSHGEHLFVLDPSGAILPSTLDRLVRGLDASHGALFSFPMVGLYEGDRPVKLLGSIPWEPERLKLGNWIDSMALWRRNSLLRLGCFSTDRRLAGWEAFDLLCKCADARGHGVHVPQVLAWHRRAEESDEDDSDKWMLMRERYPRLLALPA
jgi:hypothetical protein